MLETILHEIFQAYGFWALALVLIACMGGTMASQMVAIRRFSVQTATIADSLGTVVGKLDLQRASCAMHYEYVKEQSEALRSVAQELRGLVEAVHESDKERAKELMQVILELTRRTVPPPK
jgi:DNA-binding GntR family transcriptional regulator